MLLMSRCLHYPYGAEQRGAESSHFCEFVLSAKPDKGQCVYAGLTLSICIVGESPWLSILHLLDACACLLSKQTSIYLHHPFFFLQTVAGLLETGDDESGGGESTQKRGGQSC